MVADTNHNVGVDIAMDGSTVIYDETASVDWDMCEPKRDSEKPRKDRKAQSPRSFQQEARNKARRAQQKASRRRNRRP